MRPPPSNGPRGTDVRKILVRFTILWCVAAWTGIGIYLMAVGDRYNLFGVYVSVSITFFALVAIRHYLSGSPRIHTPLGTSFFRIVHFVCSPKTVDRVFGEILTDLTDEYCEALIDDQAHGRRYIRKATWVRIRGYASFWSAAVLQTWVSLAKRIFEIWKLIG